jgi:hypothetical protein
MKKHDKKIAYGCFALLVFYSPTLLHARVRVIRFEFFFLFFLCSKIRQQCDETFLTILYILWISVESILTPNSRNRSRNFKIDNFMNSKKKVSKTSFSEFFSFFFCKKGQIGKMTDDFFDWIGFP